MKKIVPLVLLCAFTLAAAVSCKKDHDEPPTPPPVIHHTVTFDSQGGSTVAAIEVAHGERARRPDNPTRDGYDFDRWTKDDTGYNAWSFIEDVVTHNVTLYAQWIEQATRADVAMELSVLADMNLQSSDYTPESWEALQSAILYATIVVDDPEASTEEFAAAMRGLEDAYAALENIGNADYRQALENTITAANVLVASNYTAASWQRFQQALADAGVVVRNRESTDGSLGEMVVDLRAAMDGLEFAPAGTTGGGTVGDGTVSTHDNDARMGYAATTLDPTEYTVASWNNLSNAFNAAGRVASDMGSSQEQVDAALAELNHAIAVLNHLSINDPGSEFTVDRDALQQFIDDARLLVRSNYTAATWQPFETALNEAVSYQSNTASTQAQIDAAYNKLQNACEALADDVSSPLVQELIRQLTVLVATLPSPDFAGVLNYEALAPVAMLADNVRDQLIPMLGTNRSLEVDATAHTLDEVLRSLGLYSLITDVIGS